MPTKHFLSRIKQGLRPDSTSLVRLIEEETYLNLRPYSFRGHEFQQYIVELIEKNLDIDLSVEKCSQIGASEVFFRVVLGLMALTPGYAVGYLMPSVAFSNEVLKTRISPIIETSPLLKTLIHPEVDSSSVKMFKNSSILYALGASVNSKTTLINRPMRLALSDELDKLDYDVHTGLRSRQTHQPHKPAICLSTPTYPGVGINAEAAGRQLHRQIIICQSCKHEYFPDYFTQVELPGYQDPILSLTQEKINQMGLDTNDAFHFCPECHTPSDLSPPNRQWVVEDKHLRKIHVRLTPFDAPSFIKPGDLVASQIRYSSIGEFRNQSLGLPTELKDATVDVTQVVFINEEAPTGLRIAGMDLGKISHYMEATLSQNKIIVDKIELLPVATLETDVVELVKAGNVCSMCADSLPFLDTSHKLSGKIPQYWPAIYTVPVQPQPELFKLKMNDDENVRQVNVQKNLMMDTVAAMLMDGQIVFRRSGFDKLLLEHFQSMRRVRDYKFQDIRFKWVKSTTMETQHKAEDHLWHTLIYLVVASKIIGQANFGRGSLPITTLLHSFQTKVHV